MSTDSSSLLSIVFASAETTGAVIGALEAVVDTGMEDGFLREYPLISTAHGIFAAIGRTKERFLLRKVFEFIDECGRVSATDREQFRATLDADPNEANRIGELVLHHIERLDTPPKARLTARALAARLGQEITEARFMEFHALIEQCFLSDLPYLPRNADRMSAPDAVAARLLSVGALMVHGGFPIMESGASPPHYYATELGLDFRARILRGGSEPVEERIR